MDDSPLRQEQLRCEARLRRRAREIAGLDTWDYCPVCSRPIEGHVASQRDACHQWAKDHVR